MKFIFLRNFRSGEPSPTSVYNGTTKACVIAALSVFILIAYIYAAFISKTKVANEDNIFKDDYYYCYLVPLTVVPTLAFVYLNYLSMRYFEQN